MYYSFTFSASGPAHKKKKKEKTIELYLLKFSRVFD